MFSIIDISQTILTLYCLLLKLIIKNVKLLIHYFLPQYVEIVTFSDCKTFNFYIHTNIHYTHYILRKIQACTSSIEVILTHCKYKLKLLEKNNTYLRYTDTTNNKLYTYQALMSRNLIILNG